MNNLNGTKSIKKWLSDDKPREKLLNYGVKTLSNAELLALLIGTGTKQKNAIELGKELLNICNGNLSDFGKLSVDSLCQVNGIGPSKAITISAALEIGRRRANTLQDEKKRIHSSIEAYKLVQSFFCDSSTEKFCVIFLNTANKVLSIEEIASGGLNSVTVDTRIVFKKAIEKQATNLILCHNHPSGNLQPSESDKILTKRFKECAELFFMNIIDHLIVTDVSFYSFADNLIL